MTEVNKEGQDLGAQGIAASLVPETSEERNDRIRSEQGFYRGSGGLPGGATEPTPSRVLNEQVLWNRAHGYPDQFEPESIPDPRSRRGERTPWWRGSSQRRRR